MSNANLFLIFVVILAAYFSIGWLAKNRAMARRKKKMSDMVRDFNRVVAEEAARARASMKHPQWYADQKRRHENKLNRRRRAQKLARAGRKGKYITLQVSKPVPAPKPAKTLWAGWA